MANKPPTRWRKVKAAIRQRVPFFHGRFATRPSVRLLLRLADLPAKALFREARTLPPNDLRVRVGVGGRLVSNQIQYLTRGSSMWMWLLARGMCTFESDIVEFGSGVGRRTRWMRDYRFKGEYYTGHYIGIDVDAEMLAWCRANFDDRFTFVQSTHTTAAYVNDQAEGNWFEIPTGEATIDLVFGTSVFTHLLEDQLLNYLVESFRVLRPGGWMMQSAKCLDLQPENRGNTYQHQIGNAWVENREIPEAAVAYQSAYLIEQAEKAGFVDVRFQAAPGDAQQALIGRKPG